MYSVDWSLLCFFGVICELALNSHSTNPLLDNPVETFNFINLVKAYDTARTAQRGLSDWTPPGKTFTSVHLEGSDSKALGGDLAYQYGIGSDLGQIDLATELQVIGSASFAQQMQTLLMS